MMFFSLFLLVYVTLIGFLIYPLLQQPKTTLLNLKPLTKFSIVIVFKNEYQSVLTLLNQLNLCHYNPACFEVILVEDHHQKSINLPQLTFSVNYIHLDKTYDAPKKQGITQAISLANNPWIITTDGDVEIPKNWLQSFNLNIVNNPQKRMWCAPVLVKAQNGWLNHYQQWDFLSLQAATLGGFYHQKPLMCNGANLCYEASLFKELGGFKDNLHIATGDDVFLMFKAFDKNPDGVGYVSNIDNTVKTLAVDNLSTLINQRIRWASKVKLYQNNWPKIVGLLLFLSHLWWLIVFLNLMLFWHWHWLLLFVIKLFADLVYLTLAAKKWQQRPKFLLLSLMMHPFLQIVIMVKSLSGHYEWKGKTYQIKGAKNNNNN